MIKGGLQWVPWFQDRREFYQSAGQGSIFPPIFAIIFTELAVFMFEDATLLAIWTSSNSFDRDDLFDRMNVWTTMLSVSLCIIVLLSSILLWLRLWIWKPTCCDKVCQTLSALSFLAIFGVVILMVMTLVAYGYDVVLHEEPRLEANGFFILVIFSWSFGSFFACTLRQKSRVMASAEIVDMQNNGQQHHHHQQHYHPNQPQPTTTAMTATTNTHEATIIDLSQSTSNNNNANLTDNNDSNDSHVRVITEPDIGEDVDMNIPYANAILLPDTTTTTTQPNSNRSVEIEC